MTLGFLQETLNKYSSVAGTRGSHFPPPPPLSLHYPVSEKIRTTGSLHFLTFSLSLGTRGAQVLLWKSFRSCRQSIVTTPRFASETSPPFQHLQHSSKYFFPADSLGLPVRVGANASPPSFTCAPFLGCSAITLHPVNTGLLRNIWMVWSLDCYK